MSKKSVFFFLKDEKFYLDYKKLALKYVGSNRNIYDFAKKNAKKSTIFPNINQTLLELEELLTEYQNEGKESKESSNKNEKGNKDERKMNRGFFFSLKNIFYY